MGLYVKLKSTFWTHRKTMRLRTLIGNDALWVVPRLWSYASDNQPDGDFSDYSPDELALLIGYNLDAQALLQALHQAGFLVDNKLKDWEEHNGYHASFAERARTAALARWSKKEKNQKKEDKDNDIDIETSIASSMLQASKHRLNKLFNRRDTTTWSKKEEVILKGLMLGKEFESELKEIEAYYTSGSKYLRQDLQTLLNNWGGELDRSRRSTRSIQISTNQTLSAPMNGGF